MYGVVDFLVNLLNYFMCSLLHAMHFLLVAAVKRANQVSVEQTAHNCVCRKNDSTETEASSSSSSLFYSLADRIRSTQFCVVTNTHNPMKTGHRRINTKPTLVSDETNVVVYYFLQEGSYFRSNGNKLLCAVWNSRGISLTTFNLQ